MDGTEGRDWSLEDRKEKRQQQAEFRRRLGSRIRELRTAKGMSQENLALEAGITQFQVSEIESGKRNPSATTLWAIALALRISLAELFAGVD